MNTVYQSKLTRRQALSWLGALGAAAFSAEAVQVSKQLADTHGRSVGWPDLELPPVMASGYGQDPAMTPPERAPWPRILSAHELQNIALLGEIICPGSLSIGVPDVVDEWLSAPYAMQQQQRSLIIPGFLWLDLYSKSLFGAVFSALSDSEQAQIIETLANPGKEITEDLERPVLFFNTFRLLVAGIYFTSPEGVEMLGYEGNVPLQGDYPGPSKEAEDHLSLLLESLGLEL